MKNTILEQMRVLELRKVLVNENALLVYIQNEEDEETVDVCLRYMDFQCIKEQFLGTLPKKGLFSGLLEINRDSDAIALYHRDGENMVLDKVYSIKEHTFGNPEFLDCMYHQNFPYNNLDTSNPCQYIKKRGTKDGKH